MSKVEKHLLNEVRIIEKECLEKGISVSEWIERYAEQYYRNYRNGSMQKSSSFDSSPSKIGHHGA